MYHFYIFEKKKAPNIFDALLFSLIINYLLPEFPPLEPESPPLGELLSLDSDELLLEGLELLDGS